MSTTLVMLRRNFRSYLEFIRQRIDSTSQEPWLNPCRKCTQVCNCRHPHNQERNQYRRFQCSNPPDSRCSLNLGQSIVQYNYRRH